MWLREIGVSSLIKKLGICSIVVILLISIFFISPFLSMMQRALLPFYDMDENYQIDGEIGCTYEKKECEPSRDLILYNGTLLDDRIDWNSPWYSMAYTAHQSSEGVTVEMDETPSGCAVAFCGELSIPSVNYSRMTFNTSVSVAKGNVTIHFYVIFKDWLDSHGTIGDSFEVDAIAGENHAISLSPLASDLLNLRYEWMARAEISFHFSASTPCVLNIGNVEVAVESPENLYPSTFDIQDPEGHSIFENQYFNCRGGEWRYYDIDEMMFPGFRLTTSDNYTYHSSTYIPLSTNEVIYLPVGNYSGFAGWAKENWMPEPLGTPCNFTISDNESVSVYCRIPVHKLYLNIQPLFPYTTMSAQDYHSIWITSDDVFFYLIPMSYYRVILYPMGYYNFGTEEGYQYTNRIHYAYIVCEEIEVNSVINLNVRYSHLTLGPIVLDYGNLLWMIGCCLLGVIILIRLFPISSQPYFKRRLLPAVPLILSALLPWVQFEFDKGTTTILSSIYAPFTTTLLSGTNGTTSFDPTSFLIVSPLIVGVVFWLPLAIFLYSPLIHSKIENLMKFGDGEVIDKALIMMGPIILAVYYLVICFLNGYQVGLGLLAVFAYPFVFLVSCFWRNKKEEE